MNIIFTKIICRMGEEEEEEEEEKTSVGRSAVLFILFFFLVNIGVHVKYKWRR